MDALEGTTRLVDSTLNFISSIPFIGGEAYKPETPLNESIGDISTSMEDMPTSLETIGTELDGTAKTLEPIPNSLNSLSGDIANIQTNLDDAQKIVSQYQATLTTVNDHLSKAQHNLPILINVGIGIIVALMVWIFLAQFGLFTQGMERMRK